jgi:hypothetical protein
VNKVLILLGCLLTCLGYAEVGFSQKKISVVDVNEIFFQGTGSLTIQQGSENVLMVEGKSEDLERANIRIKDHKLHLQEKRELLHLFNPHVSTLKATVVLENLLKLSLEGNAHVTVEDFHTPRLEIFVQDKGHLEFEVETDALSIKIHDSGEVFGKGSAEKEKIQISGQGLYRGKEVTSETCDVVIEGSGVAYVQANEILKVTIKKDGVVTYSGDPTKVESQVSARGQLLETKD